MVTNNIILIPARMDSTRLPGKPLADINGKPMILHVVEKAHQANLGPVYVACDGEEIANIVRSNGGQAIITDPSHPSGTDRIYEALYKIKDYHQFNTIINLQGDLPLINPQILTEGLKLLDNPLTDIATLAAPINSENELNNPNIVKIALAQQQNTAKALYFSRAPIPFNAKKHYHHIGVYFYKKSAIDKFIRLPVSILEEAEKLEQLRALENDMRIDVKIIDKAPIGVDTEEDLIFARSLAIKSNN